MPGPLWHSQKTKAAQSHVKLATLMPDLLAFITYSYAINPLQLPYPQSRCYYAYNLGEVMN